MATKIREATLNDVGALVDLGALLHSESPRYAAFPYSRAKVEALARRLLTGTFAAPPTGGVFVADRDGEIIGMLAAFVSEHWFSEVKVASDYTFFVKPEHRGGFTAVRLVQMFEKWACEQGARYTLLGVSTGINVVNTVTMYERLGYRVCGTALTKEL